MVRGAWCRQTLRTRNNQGAGRGGERGDANIEFVIWGSALIFTVLLGLYAFRLSAAKGEIQDAAQAGARTASLARSPADATTTGPAAALASLPGGDRICVTATATVDTSAWDAGWVEVTVSCVVDFAGLNPIAAGTKIVEYSWVEPVDNARREITP